MTRLIVMLLTLTLAQTAMAQCKNFSGVYYSSLHRPIVLLHITQSGCRELNIETNDQQFSLPTKMTFDDVSHQADPKKWNPNTSFIYSIKDNQVSVVATTTDFGQRSVSKTVLLLKESRNIGIASFGSDGMVPVAPPEIFVSARGKTFDQLKTELARLYQATCVNGFVETQYGCLPQNGCPEGFGFYGNPPLDASADTFSKCKPAVMPYATDLDFGSAFN